MQQTEIIPRSHQVAAMLEGTGTHYERFVTYQVVTKLPVPKVAMLDAFARQSNKSRTEMLSILLSVAIEEVMQQLDDETRQKILDLEPQCKALLQGDA
jgi:DNA-binding protein YbaB